jgi:hypothetical protein
MKQWSFDHHIPINTSIYLERETIKVIIELRFNLSEGVTHLALATKRLSILSCHARTSAETEQIHEQEHVFTAMEKTHQLDELLRIFKGITRALADNFWELKMKVATFMSLVWVLFGIDRNYYRGLHKVYSTLKLKEVYALTAKWTPENCCCITWTILDGGRAFFDDVETTLDFHGPERVAFPQSYLSDILQNIRYANPVDQAGFERQTTG